MVNVGIRRANLVHSDGNSPHPISPEELGSFPTGMKGEIVTAYYDTRDDGSPNDTRMVKICPPDAF